MFLKHLWKLALLQCRVLGRNALGSAHPGFGAGKGVEGVEILQCIDAVNEVAQEECEEERGAWDGSQDPYYLKGWMIEESPHWNWKRISKGGELGESGITQGEKEDISRRIVRAKRSDKEDEHGIRLWMVWCPWGLSYVDWWPWGTGYWLEG